jgi:hypothetical protein
MKRIGETMAYHEVKMAVLASTAPGIIEELSVARCQDLARVHGVPIKRGTGDDLRARLIEAKVPLIVTVKVPQ